MAGRQRRVFGWPAGSQFEVCGGHISRGAKGPREVGARLCLRTPRPPPVPGTQVRARADGGGKAVEAFVWRVSRPPRRGMWCFHVWGCDGGSEDGVNLCLRTLRPAFCLMFTARRRCVPNFGAMSPPWCSIWLPRGPGCQLKSSLGRSRRPLVKQASKITWLCSIMGLHGTHGKIFIFIGLKWRHGVL